MGTPQPHLLHTAKPSPWTAFNRIFAAVYSCAILSLLYHRLTKLINSTAMPSFFINLTFFITDFLWAIIWMLAQVLRMRPIYRKEFPEKLEKFVKRTDFPALDVLICTADPYKEPPMKVVNTALSVLAYDYPTEKLSVYVSDDGGSALTLFAFMEAAKFARHWLPFCRKRNVVERCPNVYFDSNYGTSTETEKIKTLYENMKDRVNNVVERGKVGDEYITSDAERKAFNNWNDDFTPQNHPSVIQVLLDNSRDKDFEGQFTPNLIYVSREKSHISHHHFKAGALNVLLRVSAAFTNAPIILNLDCDMYSNDPRTPLRILCYYSDPEFGSKYAFVQFPQKFKRINKNDIYAGEFKRAFQIQPVGFNGLGGPNYSGTGAFFNRRAFFGGPSNYVSPEIPQLSPDHVGNRPIQSREALSLAYQVASCNYENQTDWGYKLGFRYGSLVEDFFTGFRLHCEGWRSAFCNPDNAAFLGDVPISLIDLLNQQKRWAMGLLQVAFSKYNIVYGIKNAGILLGLAYSGYSFWPLWSIPLTIYTFLPQLALLNKVSVFAKVSEPWFQLYTFLFLGSYGQECLEFLLAGGTFQRWWNDQRIWIIRALTCQLFGSIDYLLNFWGISTSGFNVTSKVIDQEQSKRYERGMFEFGVHSPMFVILATAALTNLVAFMFGLVEVFKGSDSGGLLMQTILAGYGTLNCWPIYEAMVLRKDEGKLPAKTTVVAIFLAWALFFFASLLLK